MSETKNISENNGLDPQRSAPGTQHSTPWLIAALAITGVAVFLRFYELALKPLHHDEGVNGYFLITLFRDNVYKYDPSNYHGPTLYYISLFFTKIFGLETFSIRASVAVFGVLMVVMTFFLKRYIGAVGSLAAALFIALSPGMVYISRYFIHEIFFVFCSLGIVLGVLFFIEGRKAGIFAISAMTVLLLVCFSAAPVNLSSAIGGDNQTLVWVLGSALFLVESFLVFLLMRSLLAWNEGRPIYLLLASASAALFFATKETAFITLGTMVIACFCVWLWRKIYGKTEQANELEPVHLTFDLFKKRVQESNPVFLWTFVALVFAYVGVLFFSSFFTYPKGILGAFEAYAIWTKTGNTDHTQNGFLAYAKWMTKIESPIFILSAIGTLIAFIKGRHLFAMFAGLWAFGLFAAYTIIPYKTPWLALSFILPMCLVAGYGINEIVAHKDTVLKAFGALLVAAAAGILSYQTYDLNFVNYDSDKMPYVYAHTTRGFLPLIDKINYYADKSGKGKDATIQIVSPDYWSMPWYTRDYKHANYYGRISPTNTAEMIVAKKDEQDDAVSLEYASHYKNAGEFPLRPGVTLVLLVRNDIADADAKSLYTEMDEIPVVDVTPEAVSTIPEK